MHAVANPSRRKLPAGPTLAQLHAAAWTVASDRQRRHLAMRQGVYLDTPDVARVRACQRVVGPSGERIRCRKVYCPSCAPFAARRYAKRKLIPLAQASAQQGGTNLFVTIILPPTDDLWTIGGTFRATKRTLRHVFAYMRRDHPEFGGSFVAGVLEIGLVAANEFHLLGAAKQDTLGALGFPHCEHGGAVWTPHLHMLVGLPRGANPDVLRDALTRMFDAPRQVDVRPIRRNGTLAKDVRRIGCYAFKMMYRTDHAAPHRRTWGREEVATYIRWTSDFTRCGQRAFRFEIAVEQFVEMTLAAWGLTASLSTPTTATGPGRASHYARQDTKARLCHGVGGRISTNLGRHVVDRDTACAWEGRTLAGRLGDDRARFSLCGTSAYQSSVEVLGNKTAMMARGLEVGVGRARPFQSYFDSS